MLNLFRKNAVPIALGIVIFFIGTMFTGIFFLKNISPDAASPIINRSNAVALVGESPISRQLYNTILQQLISQSGTLKDPEMAEQLEATAFRETLMAHYLLESAQKHQVKISKAEVKLGLYDVYKQHNLSGKKELKSLLALNGLPFNDFLNTLRNELKIKKMRASLNAQIQVSENDISHFFTEIKVSHILLVPPPGDSSELAIETAKIKADNVLKKIRDGLSFQKAAKQYSDDTQTKTKGGKLGWISIGQFSKEFEEAAFSLAIKEVSFPIRTQFGYHLIQVLKKRTHPNSQNLNQESIQSLIFQKRYRQLTKQFTEVMRNGRKIEIVDLKLKAIQAKNNQNFDVAAQSYQALISASPSHPTPRYLLGKLYLKQNKIIKAKTTFEKADILSDLSPALDTPLLHIELAKIYKKEKSYKKARQQYDKSISRFKKDKAALTYLNTYFTKTKQFAYRSKVKKALAIIKKTEESSLPPSKTTP